MTTRLDLVATATALAVLVGGAALLRVPPARANSGGRTGRSGKQGPSCSQCHSGGVAPTVRFSGPAELGVGAIATYRFEVHSKVPTQRAAGFDVAAGGGTLGVLAKQDERLANSELTHSAPQHNVDMVAGWDFTWTAPTTPGTYTLFGAGNSVNLNGQSSGDRSSATTFDIIVAAADTPTPTPTPTLPEPTAIDTPTATSTPTPPAGDTPTGLPSASPAACAGDCDDSGAVAVNELITGVNIALGNAAIDDCPVLDVDADGAVEISELIRAVDSALNGCADRPAVAPRAAPT